MRIFLLLFFIPFTILAAPTPSQTNYINHLRSNHYFYDAITETYRYHFFSFPQTRESEKMLNFRLSEIYLQGGNNNLARNHLLSFLNQYKQNDTKGRIAQKYLALSYEREGDLANALHYWSTYAELYSDPMGTAKACEMSIKLLRKKETERFLKSLETRKQDIPAETYTTLNTQYTSSLKLPQRNETLAIVLAAIPGMSQIYCGKTKEGMIAFLVQVGAGFLTWERWNSGDKITSILIGMTDFSWYSYNFTRAKDDCFEYNRKIQRQFRTSFTIPIDF